jgi:hypothetical protein
MIIPAQAGFELLELSDFPSGFVRQPIIAWQIPEDGFSKPPCPITPSASTGSRRYGAKGPLAILYPDGQVHADDGEGGRTFSGIDTWIAGEQGARNAYEANAVIFDEMST